MRKESLIHKILRKLGFIKDIEDDRKLKMEMCERARNANVCPDRNQLADKYLFQFPADDEI